MTPQKVGLVPAAYLDILHAGAAASLAMGPDWATRGEEEER